MLLVWRAIVFTRRANRRMKDLGNEQNQFYTNASHQLRTPLTLINGPLQQLNESKTLSEGDHELLDIVQRNAEQLLHLVTDVLQFQKETQKMIKEARSKRRSPMTCTPSAGGRYRTVSTTLWCVIKATNSLRC